MSPFMAYLAEGMLPASYGLLEPVWMVIRPELLKDEADSIHFLIRRDFQSDYLEAADFINAGNGDAVIVEYDFTLFCEANGGYLVEFLKRIDVPVLLSLKTMPEDLCDSAYHNLMNSCDAAVRVIVMNKHDYELLSTRYSIAHSKLEYIALNQRDDPLDPQINWFHLGRQYWRLVEEHLRRAEGDLRSLQVAREHSVLYGQ